MLISRSGIGRIQTAFAGHLGIDRSSTDQPIQAA
jgi:hypothetical protein